MCSLRHCPPCCLHPAAALQVSVNSSGVVCGLTKRRQQGVDPSVLLVGWSRTRVVEMGGRTGRRVGVQPVATCGLEATVGGPRTPSDRIRRSHPNPMMQGIVFSRLHFQKFVDGARTPLWPHAGND